ncbi:coiled-coil domain-containing protein 25-like isoform X1 [Glandiceps talaboti]
MVFYFTSNVINPSYSIYMGADKHENEDLLRWGFPEDVWFHVDKLSSAHVYLRLQPGETLDDVPTDVLQDCAQLVKANSIQGNKLNNIAVVYTPFLNLKKTQEMDVGQVGFFKNREVRTITVDKRINEIINRLNKTKEERFPDLQAEREQRDREERAVQRKKEKDVRQKEKEEAKRRREEAELRSYSGLMKTENMASNKDNGSDSDDFM